MEAFAALKHREPEQGPRSREVPLAGIIVAMIALMLGAFGPRFRWRGAALMLTVMLIAGILATLDTAREAQSLGLRFVVTPWSVLIALAGQALFAFGFYGMAVLARATLCAFAPCRRRVAGGE